MISSESLAEYCRIHERVRGAPVSPRDALPQALALLEFARIAHGFS